MRRPTYRSGFGCRSRVFSSQGCAALCRYARRSADGGDHRAVAVGENSLAPVHSPRDIAGLSLHWPRSTPSRLVWHSRTHKSTFSFSRKHRLCPHSRRRFRPQRRSAWARQSLLRSFFGTALTTTCAPCGRLFRFPSRLGRSRRDARRVASSSHCRLNEIPPPFFTPSADVVRV